MNVTLSVKAEFVVQVVLQLCGDWSGCEIICVVTVPAVPVLLLTPFFRGNSNYKGCPSV